MKLAWLKRDTLKWYYMRFRAMSIFEASFRLNRFARIKIDRILLSLLGYVLLDKKFKKRVQSSMNSRDRDSTLERMFAQFKSNGMNQLNLDDISRTTAIRFHLENYSENQKKTVSEANKIVKHTFEVFGSGKVRFAEKIKWNWDFLANRELPMKFWADINHRDPDLVSEIKYTWELNRHQHLVTLGKAYYLTGYEKYAIEVCDQIRDWIRSNPPYMGVNWSSPLELALRIISWIWTLKFIRDSEALDRKFFYSIMKSIYQQAEHINKYLSQYSSANNHLIGELTGLIYVGTLYPEFRNMKKWGRAAFEIFFSEFDKQVYEDGVDKEQAIYYHAYMVDFAFLVITLAQSNAMPLPVSFLAKVEKMCDFIMSLTDLNGNVPSIGDDDGGIAIKLCEADYNNIRSILATAAVMFNRSDFKKFAREFDEKSFWLVGIKGKDKFDNLNHVKPTLNLRSFANGGYHILRSGNGNGERLMVFDCGPLGYLSLAAHGHADCLSINLNVFGEPVLIDPGTYLYHGGGKWRNYFRGTSAHNTVVVDEQNQSEMEGAFLWSHRAEGKFRKCERNGEYILFEGSHNGYERLPNPVIHTRKIIFVEPNLWIIKDLLTGKGSHRFDLHFHLGSCNYKKRGENEVVAKFNNSNLRMIPVDCSDSTMSILEGTENPIQGWRSPSFGTKRPSPVVRFTKIRETPASFITILYSYKKDSNFEFPEKYLKILEEG